MANRALRTAIAVLLFLLSTAVTAQFLPRCNKHSECNDNIAATFDYCAPLASVCINVPKELGTSLSTTIAVRRTRNFIVRSANRAQLTLPEQVGILNYVTFQQLDLHPHRDLHLSFLKIDIIPQLVALNATVIARAQSGNPMKNIKFHAKILNILQQLDDFHSQYLTPAPLRQGSAFLPFNMAEFYEGASKTPRFIVSQIVEGSLRPNQNANFKVGVEIIKWNNIPVFHEILSVGQQGIGANPAAKLARGLQDITNRNFVAQVLPKPGPVKVQYKDLNGKIRTTSFKWIYFQLPLDVSNRLAFIPNDFPPGTSVPITNFNSAVVPQPVGSSTTTSSSGVAVKRTKVGVTAPFDNDLSVESVEVTKGIQTTNFGIIKFFDFVPFGGDSEAYFVEIKRLVLGTVLPKSGIVLDIRNNPGGFAAVCQRIPQLFTNSIVFSAGVVARLTDLTAGIVLNTPRSATLSEQAFQALRDTNQMKIQIGDQFSAFNDGNLTALINADPGFYSGPVILLTSATSYSCGDVVAANFLDTQPQIGKVIGVANATGGGAGLQLDSKSLFDANALLPAPIFPAPPGGIYTRFNAFRIERTGLKVDSTFEWFGIPPNDIYHPTRADATNNDVDLAAFLANELNNM